jgi:hypothetical protein
MKYTYIYFAIPFWNLYIIEIKTSFKTILLQIYHLVEKSLF